MRRTLCPYETPAARMHWRAPETRTWAWYVVHDARDSHGGVQGAARGRAA